MAAELALSPPAQARSRPSTVVAWHTARRAARSSVIWGYVFGVAVASSALSYSSIYKTQAERDHLAASFGPNHAATALFGPAPQLQTVAGFTVFKVSMTLMIIGAVWGLLTSTRLLRGEEDNGRWELLLSGATTRSRAAFQALAGLGLGAAIIWAITAAITAVAGLSSKVDTGVAPALYLALALVASPVMFLAVGALTSQLAPTRGQAAGFAGTFLGASYALRMVADAGVGLHWLVWLSPLGWVEELRPLTSPHPAALLPVAGLTAVVSVLAIKLAGGRDIGASVVADRTSAPPRLRLLGNPTGLTVRLVRPTAIGWIVAVAVAGLLLGVVAKAAGSTISGSSVQKVFGRLGAPGTGADAFLGLSFLILGVLVSYVAAGQVSAAQREEAGGRLDHVLSQPVPRWSWFAGRVSVAAALLVAAGLVAGVSAWAGAATQAPGVRFAAAIDAGLNIVPPALVFLGLGALAIGVWPRRASVIVNAALAWSLLVELLGGFAVQSHWLLDTSVFHQVNSAPAVAPDWAKNGVITAIAGVCVVAGLSRFSQRDLQGE